MKASNRNVEGKQVRGSALQRRPPRRRERWRRKADGTASCAGLGRDRNRLRVSPRVWDHLRQRPCGAVLPHCAPPYTIHVGDEEKGEFAGRQFIGALPGQIGSDRAPVYVPEFDPASLRAKIDYRVGHPVTHSRIEDTAADICKRLFCRRSVDGTRLRISGQAWREYRQREGD